MAAREQVAAAPVAASELDAVVALIVAEQRQPERMIPTLGDEAATVLAELHDLAPPWADTVRVVRDEAGGLAGAVLVDWDDEVGRAWIHGPWVAGDDDRWDRCALPLLDAALAQVPAGVTSREMSGHVDNVRLAALAGRLGWRPTVVSHVLLAGRTLIESWPERQSRSVVRAVEDEDLPAVRALHDAEFPATYATAEQLLRGSAQGELVVLVAVGDEATVLGYAAGRVQPDGEGCIDFLAVDPSARGAGVGRQLVMALSRRLVAGAPKEQVCMSVQDVRAAARALYAGLGFRTLLSIVGYRSEPPPAAAAQP